MGINATLSTIRLIHVYIGINGTQTIIRLIYVMWKSIGHRQISD